MASWEFAWGSLGSSSCYRPELCKRHQDLTESLDDLIRKVLGPCEIRQDKGR